MHKDDKDLNHCLLRNCNYRMKEDMGKPEPATPDNADPQICAKECFQILPKETAEEQKAKASWYHPTFHYEDRNNPMNPLSWTDQLNNCVKQKCNGIDHRRTTKAMANAISNKSWMNMFSS